MINLTQILATQSCTCSDLLEAEDNDTIRCRRLSGPPLELLIRAIVFPVFSTYVLCRMVRSGLQDGPYTLAQDANKGRDTRGMPNESHCEVIGDIPLLSGH